jgi:uncharacterized secreted protein with C-terminal beta-propeller domain
MIVVVGMAGAIAVFSFLPVRDTPTGSSKDKAGAQGIRSFSSYSQLQAFMAANARSAQQYGRSGAWFGVPQATFGTTTVTSAATLSSIAATSSAQTTPSFTSTNVQVQGVDEPDRVKTDGTHLFVSTNDAVTVISAYPPNSTSILSTIPFKTASVLGIEISQDRLLVVDQRNSNSIYIDLVLYDTSNLRSPTLVKNMSVSGFYVASRLAQGYFYAIIQQPSYQFDSQGNATADGIRKR